MYGTHDASVPQKLLVCGLNLLGVVLSGGLMYGALLHPPLLSPDPLRRGLVLGCALVYVLRLIGTNFLMLRRRLTWNEAWTVGVWVVIIQLSMAALTCTHTREVGWLAWLGVALYLIGSALNSGSENQRRLWKRDPAHRGQLYTSGLFRFSRHINYFGDVTAFTGFALVTGSPWALLIPALMLTLMWSMNVPMLDRHLAEHYAAEYPAYARRTPAFVPWWPRR